MRPKLYILTQIPNLKVFNFEIKTPIDFENQLVVDDIIKNDILGHLDCPYILKSVSLSINRKDNYVVVVLVELILENE
ncbi:hypothetical protein SAMN04487907_10319 [Zunongwangia mangrovi]|uniref:Uncharacterized protein n=1 Tax=Zunongwangia mangrovi TaxID=1334022 RepID=A0A1I1HE48_9FLAO|nr:hypothetical protein SAMN04487907_10319 [Zunongwangia mangrovi]